MGCGCRGGARLAAAPLPPSPYASGNRRERVEQRASLERDAGQRSGCRLYLACSPPADCGQLLCTAAPQGVGSPEARSQSAVKVAPEVKSRRGPAVRAALPEDAQGRKGARSSRTGALWHIPAWTMHRRRRVQPTGSQLCRALHRRNKTGQTREKEPEAGWPPRRFPPLPFPALRTEKRKRGGCVRRLKGMRDSRIHARRDLWRAPQLSGGPPFNS